MPPLPARLFRIVALLALAWPVLVAAGPTAPLTVFAAASLKESMDEAARTYQRQTGIPVRVAYAASSTLARQIEQGAPADVFVSADQQWMDYLQARGKIDPAGRRALLGNHLVVVAPARSTAQVDLRRPATLLGALGNGRLAMGQANSVPAGKYARAALESLGLWNRIQSRLAESESVRAALMRVARGETPLGIVYRSDAQAEPAVRIVATFPADSHPAIVYPAAPVRGRSHAATAFVEWLSTPAAQAIFHRHGFAPPPA